MCLPGRRMSSKPADDVLTQTNILNCSKHLITIRRNESFKRLANEHKLVVVCGWRTVELGGVEKRRRTEVEFEHAMNAGAVSCCHKLRGGVASQLE